jgi:hypothetical protein
MRRTITVAVVAAVVGAVIATPIAVYASHSFHDVPDSNTFHEDIAWLADAGVTKGCNPPDNTEYCPKDNVSREQMAAFMRRLAENQVVDAGTLEGKTASDLMAVSAPFVEWAEGPGITEFNPWDESAIESKTELLTVTIDAPSAGQVVVIGFGMIGRQHVQGQFADDVVFDVTDDFEAFDPIDEGVAFTRIPVEWPSGYLISMATPNRVFDVAAGMHSFTLVAAKPDSADLGAAVTDVRLSAMFFPNS